MRKLVLLSFLAACTGHSTPGPDAPSITDGPLTDAGTDSTHSNLIDGPLGTAGMCDVVTQMGCAPGQGCYPTKPYDSRGYCAVSEGGTQGGGCTQDSNCASGFVCLEGSTFRCTAICTSDATCPSSMPTCSPFPHGKYGECVCTTGTCP